MAGSADKEGLLLTRIGLTRAVVPASPDAENLWSLTLVSGGDERIYLVSSDHLRTIAEVFLKKVSS